MIVLDCLLKKKKEKIKFYLDVIMNKCEEIECKCYYLRLKDILVVKKFGLYFIIKLVDLDYFLVFILIDKSKILFKVMIEYFQLLYMEDKEFFKGIFYIVLNGFYDEEDFSSIIVGEFKIMKENMINLELEVYIKRIQLKNLEQQKLKFVLIWLFIIFGSLKERNIVYVFWYNFLYICVF